MTQDSKNNLYIVISCFGDAVYVEDEQPESKSDHELSD